jgi:hypothetical protein
MRARYYSPELRRFINADPIGFAGGLNVYAFAGGNPIMLMDPLGLYNVWNSATWGVPNGAGWTWRDSLNPLHESAAWGGTLQGAGEGVVTTLQGTAAFTDGFVDIIPFVEFHPLEYFGSYDSSQYNLGGSQIIGSVTRDIVMILGGTYAWRSVPILGGSQMTKASSAGLSLFGISPMTAAFNDTTLSLASSVLLTQSSRLSTLQKFYNVFIK